MTDKNKEALLSRIDADIEYLNDTYFREKHPDKRSIDYEFGNHELTLGDLKTIRAALEFARDSGWQPIETAPRDGTIILICETNRRGFRRVYPASYNEEKRNTYPWVIMDDYTDLNGFLEKITSPTGNHYLNHRRRKINYGAAA